MGGGGWASGCGLTGGGLEGLSREPLLPSEAPAGGQGGSWHLTTLQLVDKVSSLLLMVAVGAAG